MLPLAAKLRSARRARTFFIDGVHKGGAALSLPFGEDGAVLKPCSNRAQAKFCRAQNGAQNKKSRKPALLKAPFPHFLLGWVQGEIVWRVKPRTAANLWHCPFKMYRDPRHTAIIHYSLFIIHHSLGRSQTVPFAFPSSSARGRQWGAVQNSAAHLRYARQPRFCTRPRTGFTQSPYP